MFKAQPFESEALDRLAEAMNVESVLKKRKLQRYYLSPTLPMPCLSNQEALIFNAGFYNMLQPEEALAVAAHEFTHVTKKHIKKRLPYTVMPAALIAFLVGGLLAFNPFSIPSPSYLHGVLPIAGAILFSFLIMVFVCLHLFSKALRQQETECDLSALNYGYGEAMISALKKTNANIVQSKWQIRLGRILPKTHPTGEQRIRDIQTAINRKKPVDYVV